MKLGISTVVLAAIAAGTVHCSSGGGTLGQDATGTGSDASASADGGSNGADGTTGDGGSIAHDGAAGDGASSNDGSAIADTGVTLGQPIMAPSHTWTWVDFPDSFCDDGSNTGIGVNTSTASSSLIIFLNGGGACWDYVTCFQLNTATHGPIGRPEFDASVALFNRGIFDRSVPANSFRDWSFAVVPYCTGDVHAGSRIAMYTGAGGTRPYYHTGHTNVLAYLSRLAATFPTPEKLVLAGSSAGGYGASFNYAAVRAFWPNAKAYMLDDSGPALEASAVSSTLRDAWIASWGLDELFAEFCGDPCKMDFSFGLTALSQHYPNDRLALLSSLQDSTIRSYYGLTPMQFETALLAMSADRLEPTSNFKYFFVTGQTHTMLGNPDRFMSGSTQLTQWLHQFVSDDPAWVSLKP